MTRVERLAKQFGFKQSTTDFGAVWWVPPNKYRWYGTEKLALWFRSPEGTAHLLERMAKDGFQPGLVDESQRHGEHCWRVTYWRSGRRHDTHAAKIAEAVLAAAYEVWDVKEDSSE